MTGDRTAERPPRETVRRARDAQALLEHPLFLEAWEAGRRHYLAQIEDERDPARRDKLWQALQVFKVVRAYVEALVRDGEANAKIHAAHDKKLQAAGRRSFTLRRPPLDILRSHFGGEHGTR